MNWMKLTERMSAEKEEGEEEMKGKGRGGGEGKKKEGKTGKKKMRIKETRRGKQRGRWENVQSLNPGPPKSRDHRDEEKAAQSIKAVVRASEGKLGDALWIPS